MRVNYGQLQSQINKKIVIFERKVFRKIFVLIKKKFNWPMGTTDRFGAWGNVL